MQWKANWIWAEGKGEEVNQYLYARKTVKIPFSITGARAYCSCYSKYKLFINGRCVGKGPSHCNPAWQYYDEYDLTGYFKTGINVIGVICYNYGIGTHNRPYCRGGFLFQGEVVSGERKIPILSDDSWKVLSETPWAKDSPRLYFTAGFQEIFDKREEPCWQEPDFDDSSWEKPEVIGQPPAGPWLRLIPGEIPFLRETVVFPESVLKTGRGERPAGLFNINFHNFLSPGEKGIVYAATYCYSESRRKVQLTLACDDAFKIWVNEKVVLCQQYSEQEWVRWIPDERERYHQFHKGYGIPKEKACFTLRRGWNKILIKISQGVYSWGLFFQMSFLPGKSCYGKPVYSARKKTRDAYPWMLAGPFPDPLKNGRDAGMDTVYPPEKEINFRKCYSYGDCTARWKPFKNERDIIEIAGFLKAENKSISGEGLFVNPSALLSDDEKVTAVKTEGRKSSFLLCDFGQEVVGSIKIDVSECGGGILDIGYSEWLDESGNADPVRQGIKQADRFILRKGEQTLQTFSRRAFRYVHLAFRSCPCPVKIRNVQAVSVNYPVEYQGLFRCSDGLLNDIWKVSRYTLQLCMQDHYEDCPLRERAQYVGDMRVEAVENYYAFGDYKLSRKGLKQFIQSQEPSGWFRADYPSATYHQIVDYCAVWVIALYDYYLHTGDSSFVSELYPNLLAVLGWFESQMNRRKFIPGKEGWWVFIDWTDMDKTGDVAAFQMFYYMALTDAAKLSSALKDHRQASKFLKLAGMLKKSINRYFWSEKKGAYADCWNECRQSVSVSYPANCLAILSGIADERRSKKIYDAVFNNSAVKPLNAPYFYFYFLNALFKLGKDADAVLRTKKYYGKMLEYGATTWWEWFVPGAEENPRGVSLCHAYSSSPAYIFPSRILGVSPLEPGFARFRVAPMPGELKWAEGKVPVPEGIITVYWKRDREKNSFELEITSPQGCRAEVVLPPVKFSETVVKINGKVKYPLKHAKRGGKKT